MRITNQEIVRLDTENPIDEVRLEVILSPNLLSSRTEQMGQEVADVFVGKLFIDQLKEALSKLNPPA